MTKFSKFASAAMAASALVLSAGAAKAELSQSAQLAQARAAFEASARDYDDIGAGFQKAEDIAVVTEQVAEHIVEAVAETLVAE